MREEALDRTMWRACFERGFGPVVRQTTKWMDMCLKLDTKQSSLTGILPHSVDDMWFMSHL